MIIKFNFFHALKMHGFLLFVSAAITVNRTSQVAFLVVIFCAAIYMWLALVLFVGVNTVKNNLKN